MEILIIAVLLIVLLAIWIVSTQRKLVVMDENINNAVGQIGVQLSLCFDALIFLLDLTKSCAADESGALSAAVQAQRRSVTAQSTAEEVLDQERIIFETVGRIITMSERFPQLKTDKNYIRYMDAIGCYEGMVHTSCLIYNDSVTKLNRSLRSFPTSLIAGILGFRRRGYLETSVHNEP